MELCSGRGEIRDVDVFGAAFWGELETSIYIYILSTSDKGVVKRMVGFTTPLSWVLKHF